MPITSERQNIQDLRAVGFTEAQSVLLAEKLEATAKSTSDDMKAFIVAELDKRFSALEARLDARFAAVDARFAAVDARFAAVEARMDTRFAEQEGRFERAMRLQLVSILTAFVGVTGLAVALIKLLP